MSKKNRFEDFTEDELLILWAWYSAYHDNTIHPLSEANKRLFEEIKAAERKLFVD